MPDHATFLAAASRPEGMTAEEATALLDAIVAGALSAEHGAGLLVAMHRRGETAVELAAWVRGLLPRAIPMQLGRVMDIVGTGGTGRARYNVSTTACFVLAAAGVPVAKHGNKGSNHANGSFDLLEALGIPVPTPLGSHRQLLDDTGCCFIFARQAHPAVGAAAPMRKLAAASVSGTIYNLAGPLANPARPPRILLGAGRRGQGRMLADTLRLLGCENGVVAHGHPGIDEVSITGETWIHRVDAGGVREDVLPAPATPAPEAAVMGGDCAANAASFHRLLAGEERGPLLDYLAANAGTALAVWRGLAPADAGCRAEARELVLGGKAKAAFARHRAAARRLAGLPD